MNLPELIRECLTGCQDDQAYLEEDEAQEILELARVLEEAGIKSINDLVISIK